MVAPLLPALGVAGRRRPRPGRRARLRPLGNAARTARPPGNGLPVRFIVAGRVARRRRRCRHRPAPAAAPPRCWWPGPACGTRSPRSAEIAAVYPGCQPLVAAAATVDATLRALDGAPLAHLAAHGYHDRENVLFSRLDLADGPLMAYDVQRLSHAPAHVVLSACDVGRTVVRPGDEILGFTAALLHMGRPR